MFAGRPLELRLGWLGPLIGFASRHDDEDATEDQGATDDEDATGPGESESDDSTDPDPPWVDQGSPHRRKRDPSKTPLAMGRLKRPIAVGAAATTVVIVGAFVLASLGAGDDPVDFRVSAQTMIAERPISTEAVACPEGKSVSPVEYVDTSALASEIPLLDNELLAVRLRLTPLTDQVPPTVAFRAAWPTRVVDPTPTCAFLLTDDTNASLEWAPVGEGGASFTVTDPSSVEPVIIEVWMRAADPETGASFSTSFRTDSASVSVDALGGRVRVDRRSDFASPDVSFPPVIDVWYGDTQPFGRAGRAQQWVNVVGRAIDHDGISSLTYSLNGGPEVDLSVGPDLLRLAREGDFNIQIGYDDLATGPNQIVITAIDRVDSVATTEVTLLVSADSSPALPVEIEFDPSRSILEQAAVVDGPWLVNTDGSVTADALAYDRILAIGDTSWQDYEVNLTVSVHSLGTDYDTPQSGNFASVGLALRWVGHTQRSDEDLYLDHFPVGALISHEWSSDPGWRIVGNPRSPSDSFASTPEFDTTYRWRAQVQSIEDGTVFRFKQWPLETAEPSTWDVEIVDDDSPTSGSVALVAHHVDADFGPVTITPLS